MSIKEYIKEQLYKPCYYTIPEQYRDDTTDITSPQNVYRLGNIISWSLGMPHVRDAYQSLAERHSKLWPESTAARIYNFVQDTGLEPQHNKPDMYTKYCDSVFGAHDTQEILCAHLRIGDDLLDRKTWNGNKQEFFYFKNPATSKQWWDDVIQYAKSNNISKIYFVTGIHNLGEDNRRSASFGSYIMNQSVDFVYHWYRYVESNDLEPVLFLNNNPDDDFKLLLDCKCLFLSYGSYGKWAREFRKHVYANFETKSYSHPNAEL